MKTSKKRFLLISILIMYFLSFIISLLINFSLPFMLFYGILYISMVFGKLNIFNLIWGKETELDERERNEKIINLKISYRILQIILVIPLGLVLVVWGAYQVLDSYNNTKTQQIMINRSLIDVLVITLPFFISGILLLLPIGVSMWRKRN